MINRGSVDVFESMENRILCSLRAEQRGRLGSRLDSVNLSPGLALYEAGDTVNSVFFPNSGVVSLLSCTEEGQSVEVAMTGVEGMVGVPVALRTDTIPYRALVQTAGVALRLDAGVFKDELARGGILQEQVLRYTAALIGAISQSATCNRFHTVKERLCRWLLVAYDRACLDSFSLTQEFLSNVIGSSRQGVNEAVASLQRDGMISCERSSITVLDQDALESGACECYILLKQAYDEYLRSCSRLSSRAMSAT